MKLVKKTGTLGLVVLAAIASPCLMAQDSGWYIGGNVGQSRAKIDDPRIIKSLTGSGFTVTSIIDDDRKTGSKWFAGYQINKYFALEGGYFDLRKFGFVAATVPLGTLTGDIKLTGYNLDLVGIVPLTDRFSAFARVGANNAQATDHFVGTGFVNVINPNPRKRDTNIKYGVGLQYAFNDALASC